MTDVAFTVGNREQTAATASRTPVLLGFSSDLGPIDGPFDYNFIDWPFEPGTTANRFQHSLWVEAHTPKIAVAPDISTRADAEAQQQMTLGGDVRTLGERNTLVPSTVLDLAEEMEEHAETVVLVPTDSGFPVADVPDRFRVGVPSSPAFGVQSVPDDLLFRPSEYNAHPGGLHLLGGGADRQLTLANPDGGGTLEDVRSVDTTFPSGRLTRNGLVWDGEMFRPPADQPDFLRDLEFLAKMYVSLQTYAHTWGMVDLLELRGVRPRAGESLTDALLRAAMTDADRDLEAIGRDLLPASVDTRVDIRESDGVLQASFPAGTATDEQLIQFDEALRDFGFTDIEQNVVRGAVVITAQPPDPDPDTSPFGLRPGA